MRNRYCCLKYIVLILIGVVPIFVAAQDQNTSTASAAAVLLPNIPSTSPLLSDTPQTKTTTITTTTTHPSTADNAAQFHRWVNENQQNASITTISSSTTVQKPPRIVKKIIRPPHGPDAPDVISPPMTLAESQRIMLDSAPPYPPPSDESQEAFNSMMQQNMPMTPQQVIKMHQMIDTSQRAASIPANIPPKPVSSTLIANLAPGATPPAIRVAQGYISSLVFVDSAGAPWPIASYDIGDTKATTIQWDGKSNILLIQAITPYSDSNLVVRLIGLPTPLTLELVSGQRVVDFRIDIHVPGIGPNTKDLPIGTPLPDSANQLLLGVLDGVAPPGSKLLTVAGGGDCQAWLFGDKMYLRTRLTVLSPGWIGKMTSPDGMYAYEMPRTSSVLVSQYGEPVEMKIGGF